MKKIKLDGKSLERATELIETHILTQIKKSEIGEIKIQKNKLLNKNGVKNEIDVFVTVNLKIGTSLNYIFECKNYKDRKVNKNDIIIFEEKINLANAQKGYFVAKKYTSDAINRAKQCSRIEILYLDNENSRIFDKDYFSQIKSVYIDNCNVNIEVFPPIPFEKDFSFLPIKIPDAESQTVSELVMEKLLLGTGSATKYRTRDDLHKGIAFQSEYEKVETLHFDKEKWQFLITLKEPIFNNKKCDWIKFKIDVDFIIELPEIIYEYNIKDRGHCVKLRIRGLFKDQYSTMEITKNDLTNEIHFHNIEPE